jgi:hypothetical protein
VSSTIAIVVLALSIPAMVGIFFFLRPVQAALVVALGAEMFLPERVSFKLPFMPFFDKHNLPYLCVFIACLLRCPARVTKLPKQRWIVVLALLLLAGGVATGLTNTDALVFGANGQVFIPGLTLKDGFYMGISNFVGTFLPLYLGYALFRKPEDFDQLFAGLAVAGLVYIPFAMVELRMSPQWHRWIYGYAQHEFQQTIRWGGYRPMVFMSHGLVLARFFLAATCSLVLLARYRRVLVGLPVRVLAWTQFLVLVACKSTGAIVFALAGIPLLALARPKRQLFVAMLLAYTIVLYPALRMSGIFPVGRILEAAGSVQTERADSLAVRFQNEDALLAHARDRIFFGWGEYDRNAVHDEEGEKTSVLDGYWIIQLSINGIVGFITAFAPLLIPVLWARRLLPTIAGDKDQRVVAGVAFLLTLLTLDLLPNGLLACYPYFIAGALTRRLRELRAEARERKLVPEAA